MDRYLLLIINYSIMVVVVPKKKRRKRFIILLPLLIVLSVLAYYQLLYRSERVDNGIAKLELIFDKHKDIVTSVRFSPGDFLIVTSSVDSTIKIWKRESGEMVKEIKQPSGIAYMDLSTDGNYVVTGNYDSTVRLWRVTDGVLLKEFKGHSGTVWTVAFSNDGKKIASGGND